MPMTVTDRIEKRVVLRAPRARVWRALSNADEFGRWFGVELEGPFVEGAALRGKVVGHPGYEHVVLELTVVKIQPEQYFAYRWHPHAVDLNVDYSAEPTTLVEFTLAEAAGGTELTIVESGFDRVPLSRRAEAFRLNDEGWAEQAKRIERYVTQA
jgi:uncharacterized protein YndB with AHSA1/START domain